MRGAFATFALLLLTGCPPAHTSSLHVGGAPLDAVVTVDDQYLGSFAYVAVHGVALPPGKHRVTVEKAGYFPWDRLVEAAGGAPVRLDIAMVKIPE